jgi:hypothetical protein
MKSLELSSLLLGFGLFCLGCQQKSSKENASETRPAASAVAKRTGETPATAAKTGEKKANEHPAKVDDRLEAERLIANLKDRDWFVRREATEALGKLGDKRAVEPLIACLKDEDNSVRLNAAYALGKLGDKRAVEPLIACLKDSDVDRAFAAEALGKLGDKRAVEPLIACLKDNAVDRSCAAEALGKLGDKRAVGPLIAALKDEDERVRRAAAEALGRLGDKQAAGPLIAALPDWPAKDAIGAALKQLDGKPATDKERFYCRVAERDDKGLLEDWKQTRQLILDDAGSQDARKVQNAVFTVIALGKEEMVDDLVKLLNPREDKEIAEIYLNCGYQGFSKAAESWAARRGYHATSGGGGAGPAWGHW